MASPSCGEPNNKKYYSPVSLIEMGLELELETPEIFIEN
jgi:hypothetical protein